MSKVVKIGTLGLVDDAFGEKAAANAATQAGNVQAQASREALAESRRQFNLTQGLIQPQIEAGDLAREQQLQLLGLRGSDAQTGALQNIQQSPAEQFKQQRAQRNLLQNASAIGGLGGGNVRSALVEQGAGFAATDINNQLAQLGAVAGQGQAATGTSAQLGAQQSGLAGQLITQGGQAQASGILGAQQAQAQGQQQLFSLLGAGAGLFAGGPSGAVAGAQVGSLLSDERMKFDINQLDLKACYDAVMSMDLKSWRYLEELGLGTNLNLGPMAQDAPEMIKIPGAEMLNVHNELMMIAGAIQYIRGQKWQS